MTSGTILGDRFMSNRKKNLLLCFTFTAMICFIIGSHEKYLLPDGIYMSIIQEQPAIENLDETELSIINRTKFIFIPVGVNVMWGYRFRSGRIGFIDAACPVSNCFISSNVTAKGEDNFDAFIFHAPRDSNLNNGKPEIVHNRRPDQVLILFSMEPPYGLPNLTSFDGYFNWTISYLTDSDFHLPYGVIEPLPSAPSKKEEISQLIENIDRSNINPARGKTKKILWMVSNCDAPSNRQDYVKELQKYIDVDIMSRGGKCGGNDTCSKIKNEDVCYDMMEKTYKFYLAFENSICRDYVTEKFFNIISRNIVPIVLGGANYSAIAPQHSYINALDFTPRQLAEYLWKIDANDTLYAEYFWWKPFYRVKNLQQTNAKVFCQLCAALHNQPIKQQTHYGLQDWYKQESKCIDYKKF